MEWLQFINVALQDKFFNSFRLKQKLFKKLENLLLMSKQF